MFDRHKHGRGLLDGLTSRQRRQIVAAGTVVAYREGQLIHRRGDNRPGVSIVLAGRVRVETMTKDGAPKLIAEFGPGHSFGEITSLIDVPRTHDVYAAIACDVLQIGAQSARRLIEDHPAFNRALLRTLAARLHLTLEMLESFRQNPPIARLAATLILRSAVAGGSTIPVTQESLAYEIGVSRVTLGKLLAALEASGCIMRGYRSIDIIDFTTLRSHQDDG